MSTHPGVTPASLRISKAHASYCGASGHGCTCGVEKAVSEYRAARTAWLEAGDREDAAFGRYFAKVRAGERTNGAATARLSNLTNYASATMYSAQGALYKLDIDPWDVDDVDGVEHTPVGS